MVQGKSLGNVQEPIDCWLNWLEKQYKNKKNECISRCCN